MAASKTYLVPLDFSRSSKVALDYAVRIARENKGKLLLIHVITDPAHMVPFYLRPQYYKELDKEAGQEFEKLRLARRLEKGRYQCVLLKGPNPARLIAKLAKKSKVSMIILGSHGRTGLARALLGSMAEKILRYAECPVLIVKK